MRPCAVSTQLTESRSACVRTRTPDAVRTGLALSLGSRMGLYSSGMAAMISTNLGWFLSRSSRETLDLSATGALRGMRPATAGMSVSATHKIAHHRAEPTRRTVQVDVPALLHRLNKLSNNFAAGDDHQVRLGRCGNAQTRCSDARPMLDHGSVALHALAGRQPPWGAMAVLARGGEAVPVSWRRPKAVCTSPAAASRPCYCSRLAVVLFIDLLWPSSSFTSSSSYPSSGRTFQPNFWREIPPTCKIETVPPSSTTWRAAAPPRKRRFVRTAARGADASFFPPGRGRRKRRKTNWTTTKRRYDEEDTDEQEDAACFDAQDF